MAKKRKPVKIKRSRNIFGHTERNRNIMRVAFWVGLLAFVFVAVFFLMKPFTEFVGNLIDNARNSPSSTVSGNSGDDTSGGTEEPIEVVPHAAVMIDISQLRNASMVTAVAADLQAREITEVVIIVKDATGVFHYASAIPTVEEAFDGVQVNAEEIISIFAEHNISVSAGIYAYQDPIAAYANRNMAVYYRGQDGVLWLDNYPENNGKPWLNPYSVDAQDYIINITKELADIGFDRVIVYAVQYPAVSSLGYTSYGPAEAQMTRDDALRMLTTKLNNLAEERGISISIEYPLSAVREEDIVSYIVNPLTLGQNSIIIVLPSTDKGVQWTAESIQTLVDAARQNGAQEVAVRFADTNYTSAENEALKAMALSAGCDLVIFG